MPTGKVKFFNESKGYGFIVDDETQQDIFVHVSGLAVSYIDEGDRVIYDLREGRKGLNAVNVQVAEA